MAAPLTLRSWYRGDRTFALEVTVAHEAEAPLAELVPPGAQLALTCTRILTPAPDSGAHVVDREAGYLVLAADRAAESDDRWRIEPLDAAYPARHANDGPESAFVILPSGETVDVSIVPTILDVDDGHAAAQSVSEPSPVAPRPISATPPRIAVGDIPAELAATVDAVGGLLERSGRDGRLTAAVPIEHGSIQLDVRHDASVTAAGYERDVSAGRVRLRAADRDGLRHGLLDLVRTTEHGGEVTSTVEAPRFDFRGVHLDLARRWYEPDVVLRLIDVAAWRRLNRIHLHLTDDEAWRFPVDGYPELATIGARRGHGLPIPPLNGSGAPPYGRAYTSAEIATWVTRADELGVVLVPEIDVPAHCNAALRALPALRDPDDRSAATSVQFFVDNVLVPGRWETRRFVEATFGSLADAFPASPVLHLGGDEVPDGAWSGAPAAQRFASDRSLGGTTAIARSFHDDVVATIRALGRAPAMWEEAAAAGVDTSGGYAVGWTSSASTAALTAAGHDVVVAAGEAYYLDMATTREWERPGASWAGTTSVDDSWRFDPLAGVDPEHRARVIGTQACIWSEHIADLDVLDELVFPRLDVIAERAWGRADDADAATVAAAWRFAPRFTTDG